MKKYIPLIINEPQINYSLEEKLFNIEKDVDYIYNESFKSFIDDLNLNILKPSPHFNINKFYESLVKLSYRV